MATPPSRSTKRQSIWRLLFGALKGLFWLTVLVTPALGVWFASSIAAYLGGPLWLPCAAGLLLFPGLPLAWDIWGSHRFRKKQKVREQRKRKPRERILTFTDRLVLRTLIVNLLFVAALLGAFPKKSFEALAMRGDWPLDGIQGQTAHTLRQVLTRGAGALEWVYLLSLDNPYEKLVDQVDETVPDADEFGETTIREQPGKSGGETTSSSESKPEPTDETDEPEPSANPSEPETGEPGPETVETEPETDAPEPETGGPEPTGEPEPSSEPEPAEPEPDTTDLPLESNAKDSATEIVTWPLASTLHPLVGKMPEQRSFTDAAQYIKQREPDPLQRVKAIHDYVADRVRYDAPALLTLEFPPQDAETVWRTKIGVCAGYANLLKAMGDITGDPIVVITGDVRLPSGEVPSVGHAWNAAKVHGKWYLLDPTWNAGHVNGDQFTQKYATDYLFTPPEIFGLNHFPKETHWQLRADSLSRAAWLREPTAMPSFYANGFEFIDPRRPQVDSGLTFVATFRNHWDRTLAATIEPREGGERQECEVLGRERIRVECPVPTGRNIVYLYVGAKHARRLDGAASIEVIRR